MEKVEIYEQKLFNKNINGQDKEIGKMAIIKGGIGTVNPKAVMDNAVREYVANESYNQFVEIHLDNPWVRVVIKGINDVSFEEFKIQRL